MKLSEAAYIYIADNNYDTIELNGVSIICDRNTKRLYLATGSSYQPTLDELLSEDWQLKSIPVIEVT